MAGATGFGFDLNSLLAGMQGVGMPGGAAIPTAQMPQAAGIPMVAGATPNPIPLPNDNIGAAASLANAEQLAGVNPSATGLTVGTPGIWDQVKGMLGGIGGGSSLDQAQTGKWAQILGSAGQAFSARDPNSWQHQLGGTAKEMGQSESYLALINQLAAKQGDVAKTPKLDSKAGVGAQANNGSKISSGLSLLNQDFAKSLAQ